MSALGHKRPLSSNSSSMSGIGGKADTGFDSKGQLTRFLSHFYKSRCVFLMPSENKATSNAVAVKNPTKSFFRYANVKMVSMSAVCGIKAACSNRSAFCRHDTVSDKREHRLAGGHAVAAIFSKNCHFNVQLIQYKGAYGAYLPQSPL